MGRTAATKTAKSTWSQQRNAVATSASWHDGRKNHHRPSAPSCADYGKVAHSCDPVQKPSTRCWGLGSSMSVDRQFDQRSIGRQRRQSLICSLTHYCYSAERSMSCEESLKVGSASSQY